jgi:hypothetical protein
MISYTPDEVEQDRTEAVTALVAEPEHDSSDHQPGTFSYHEALDRASLVMEMLTTHVLEHPAVILDQEAYTLARLVHETLFNLYQNLGGKHLSDTIPDEDGAVR